MTAIAQFRTNKKLILNSLRFSTFEYYIISCGVTVKPCSHDMWLGCSRSYWDLYHSKSNESFLPLHAVPLGGTTATWIRIRRIRRRGLASLVGKVWDLTSAGDSVSLLRERSGRGR
ncbi:hypothetical protein AVEN_103264-1 [Araneus ventricosus]|uniref:Uncharacterized protein n=1 Tax=Araneus ventricosus TaxID=182803 RepID=A0A4Y2KN20_ARAVE|nr:hypothetical protein AVEN_103264-1 [Araneus ventricosus]